MPTYNSCLMQESEASACDITIPVEADSVISDGVLERSFSTVAHPVSKSLSLCLGTDNSRAIGNRAASLLHQTRGLSESCVLFVHRPTAPSSFFQRRRRAARSIINPRSRCLRAIRPFVYSNRAQKLSPPSLWSCWNATYLVIIGADRGREVYYISGVFARERGGA